MKSVVITGNTYPVKEQIKALGGIWDKENRGWKVPADKAEAARKLVASAPKVQHRSRVQHWGSYGTIEQRRRERMERTGWSGCQCGSIIGTPRNSDCAECKHDW